MARSLNFGWPDVDILWLPGNVKVGNDLCLANTNCTIMARPSTESVALRFQNGHLIFKDLLYMLSNDVWTLLTDACKLNVETTSLPLVEASQCVPLEWSRWWNGIGFQFPRFSNGDHWRPCCTLLRSCGSGANACASAKTWRRKDSSFIARVITKPTTSKCRYVRYLWRGIEIANLPPVVIDLIRRPKKFNKKRGKKMSNPPIFALFSPSYIFSPQAARSFEKKTWAEKNTTYNRSFSHSRRCSPSFNHQQSISQFLHK